MVLNVRYNESLNKPNSRIQIQERRKMQTYSSKEKRMKKGKRKSQEQELVA